MCVCARQGPGRQAGQGCSGSACWSPPFQSIDTPTCLPASGPASLPALTPSLPASLPATPPTPRLDTLGDSLRKCQDRLAGREAECGKLTQALHVSQGVAAVQPSWPLHLAWPVHALLSCRPPARLCWAVAVLQCMHRTSAHALPPWLCWILPSTSTPHPPGRARRRRWRRVRRSWRRLPSAWRCCRMTSPRRQTCSRASPRWLGGADGCMAGEVKWKEQPCCQFLRCCSGSSWLYSPHACQAGPACRPPGPCRWRRTWRGRAARGRVAPRARAGAGAGQVGLAVEGGHMYC